MRKFLKLALMIGGIAAVAKLVAARKSEWTGLTEPQVREKLESRLPSRIPDDKRAAVADKVVSKMRERGVILEEDDTAESSGETESEAAASADATEGETQDEAAGDDSDEDHSDDST